MKAVDYMQVRLYGAPAVLLMMVSFGVLRGLQDMRTPLWIAVGLNGLNVFLDWVLIFGQGPFPALGVTGSALASTISQWLGALSGVAAVALKLGLTLSFRFSDFTRILRVGGDLFVRTGLLTFFLAYTTRAATRLGADAGAAHQVIRQVYGFTSLALDAYASTVQSLVGYFIGKDEIGWVRRVVRVGTGWSLGTGTALGLLMWFGSGTVIALLVPETAAGIFLPAWTVSALSQPVSSLAFLTDGVHWGTGDYRYLRNAMIAVSVLGFGGIWLLDLIRANSLVWIWVVIGVWVSARAVFGVLRIWPGIGKSVFRETKRP